VNGVDQMIEISMLPTKLSVCVWPLIVRSCEKVNGCGPPEFGPVGPATTVNGLSSAMKLPAPITTWVL
jgi:hypothetical protein